MKNKIFFNKKIVTMGDEKISFSDTINHLNIRNTNKISMNDGGLWSITRVIPNNDNFLQICRNDYSGEMLSEFKINELHYFDENGKKNYLMIKGEEIYNDGYDLGSNKRIINRFRYKHASGDIYETQIVSCNDFERLITLPKAILNIPMYKFQYNDVSTYSDSSLFITDCLDIYDGKEIKNYRFDFINNRIYCVLKGCDLESCDYIVFLSSEKIRYKLTLLNGYFSIALKMDGGDEQSNNKVKFHNEVTAITYLMKDKDGKEIVYRAMIIPNLKKN